MADLCWFGWHCFFACYWSMSIATAVRGEWTLWPLWANVVGLVASALEGASAYRAVCKALSEQETRHGV
jgi:hypothetical protein